MMMKIAMEKTAEAMFDDVARGLTLANSALQLAEDEGMISTMARDRFVDKLNAAWDELKASTVLDLDRQAS